MITRFDPTGARVAHGDQDGLLSVHQRTPSSMIWQQHQPAAITTLAWSWDGTYLASGDTDGYIHLWEAQTGTLMQSTKGHRGRVIQIVWSPTGYQLASYASRDLVPCLWDYVLNPPTPHDPPNPHVCQGQSTTGTSEGVSVP